MASSVLPLRAPCLSISTFPLLPLRSDMDASITNMPPEERVKHLQNIDGQLQGISQSHGVPADVQVAIGQSPCAKLGIFVEWFENKAAVKSDSPELFKFKDIDSSEKNAARLALVWQDVEKQNSAAVCGRGRA